MSDLFLPDLEILTLDDLQVEISRSPSMTFEEKSFFERLFGVSLAESFEYSIPRALITAQDLPYSTFPPSTTDPRNLGVDVSKYNGLIDFIMMAAYSMVPVEYIMIRMGQSWGYQDEQFIYNWTHAKESGIPRMAYHVIYPGQPVDPQVDNVMKIWNTVNNDYGEGPLWIDLELHHNQSPNVISNKTWEMIQKLRDRMGWDVGVYSGDWFLSAYCEPQDWWELVWWWLAHYLHPSVGQEHSGPPARPVQIPEKKVAFHQTTSYGNGTLLGTAGLRIDFNRYMLYTILPLIQFLTLPDSPQPTDLEKRVGTNEEKIRLILLVLEELKKGQGINQAKIEHLIHWAQNLQYVEA